MVKHIYILASICIVLCGCTDHLPRHVDGRIQELEDSLRAYRDSLKSAQLAWPFNSVTAVVVLQDRVIPFGDSCRAEVIIGAANTSNAFSMGYRYPEAQLDVSEVESPRVVKNDMRWIISFKPDQLGEDSLKGAIVLDGRTGREPVRLSFSHPYKVVPK